MNILGSITLICALTAVALSEKVRYDGHKVLNIIPRTARDVHDIVKMEEEFQLDFWHLPKYLNDSLHVRVGPHSLEPFLAKLRQMETAVSIWINDVQSLIDTEDRRRRERRSVKFNDAFIDLEWKYFTLDEINQYVIWQAQQNSSYMSVDYFPNRTVDENEIHVVKISHPEKKVNQSIFIDCGIHAREWISPAFCLHAIKQLLHGNHSLLSDFNWHIVPVLNPDGYAYSHNMDRLWRKNRRVNGESLNCRGVDLNRNFGFMYDPGTGGSMDACSDIYTGTEAFSEVESDGISRYILDNSDQNFVAYLTVHSYGQMWLFPWGYTSEKPEDYADLESAGFAAIEALYAQSRTRYSLGTSTEVLYSAAGGSDDWAKGAAEIKYSYTLELRDKGRYGFQLPEDQISDTVTETWEGVKALAKELKARISGVPS
ncbi:carboxypeptidase B-like [Ylistrum balloti]|uniref:carboxypeptidase B-like n=1 Tax=Ylistrum balloti TaxID=509963 RepID=UPI0029059182|nr:carboxypeptidase B-like [Ylistrum balloti]